jgi:membrane associated rhomboid family serine protease
MIAIPLTKKISWRNPPSITIAIIVINIFVFFVVQGDDALHYKTAQAFYFESDLDNIEFPQYIEFLKNHRPEAYRKIGTTDVPMKGRKALQLYHWLNFDGEFLELLKHNRAGVENPAEIKRHQSLRQEYEDLQKRIVSLQYGFRPAQHRAVTLLTTMFLHGGIGHLIGNMVFLWLIGCLIEHGCRRWLFAIIYGLGGLAATWFFWILNMNSLVPLIGASGAISGVMGAFTVLYGFKRVRIFLNLGFYFNYLKFPAIVILPLWIGNEAFQMISNPGSSVAYAAHLGGLLAGSLLALLARRIPGLLDMEGFEDAQDDPVGPMLEKALEHMGKLEFTESRKLLLAAEKLRPDDRVILAHLFTIDRQEPEASRFHRTSQKLLMTLCREPGTYIEAHQIYQDYIRLAHPVKLAASLYLSLCRVFCEIGELKDAQRLLTFLSKKRPDMEQIPATLFKLAELQAEKGNRAAQKACLHHLCGQYPQSSEARIAKQQFSSNASMG